MSSRFAPRPAPPYWAVVFTNQRSEADPEGYAAMAAVMATLAERQPGHLGAKSTRDDGRARWYRHYELRGARVERAYGRDADDGAAPPAGAGGDLA